MSRRIVTVAAIITLAGSPLLADFSYQEKSTITGGAMAGLLKFAGVFSKQAREPLESTVSVKGDRMVTRGATHMSIIDLNSQTITTVDMQKKTWYVMTFEDMKQMMEQMQQSMQNAKKNGDNTQASFKVSAKSTGNSKQVNGYDAKEMILKMEMEGTDEQTGQKGAMVITTDMWITPAVSGYSEVREFHKRMAEKLNWSPNGNMFAARPEVAQGMAEVYKEIGKLDGMPVVQSVVMGVEGQPGDQAQSQQSTQQQQPQAQSTQEQPSLRGALGGMLGVHRNKKSSSDPPPAANKDSSQPGSLLEMTTELSGFSSAAVDDSQFAVPANFKQVDSPMRRKQ